MTHKFYKTTTDFRKALESRIGKVVRESGQDVQRVRRRVAFNRFLARIFADKASPWILKGGYAMELRLSNARATRDIDLTCKKLPRMAGTSQTEYIQRLLADAAAMDLHDYFSFMVGQAMIELDGPVYGGARYPVETMMDGRLFVAFHVDAAVGDYIPDRLETAHETDLLSFVGIKPASFPMISREFQFAEKLHAYTLPRSVPNSRVRDLIDMVLLINEGKISPTNVSLALKAVFARRKTHARPTSLSPAPNDWEQRFEDMAQECGLKTDLLAGFELLNRFYLQITQFVE